jgi:hypothetical protein
MLSANIAKEENVFENIIDNDEPLTKVEINKLKKKTIGWGNMKVAQELSGLSRPTLWKAVNGMSVSKESEKKIRLFLEKK